jgi:subtilisin-like proprotein convertase family protein
LNLNGTHTYISDLDFNLTSPQGTAVQIADFASCGSQDNFNLNLDDAGTGSWPCPPTNGGTYPPTNALSAFNGQDSTGTWTLRIDDNYNADGGSLNGWSLEVCAEGTGPAPTATSVPPTATSVPPTATSVPPTATSVPPTATSVPPTATSVPPTATSVPPTATPPPSGDPCTNCTKYSGNLANSSDSNVQPNGTYYYQATAGYHTGWLEGPANADFDLYLYKWSGSRWTKVASSLGASSSESISYSGTVGYYYWKIDSYSGSGNYDFWLQLP